MPNSVISWLAEDNALPATPAICIVLPNVEAPDLPKLLKVAAELVKEDATPAIVEILLNTPLASLPCTALTLLTSSAEEATTFKPLLTAPNTPPAAAPVPVADVARLIAHCPKDIRPAVRLPFAILIVAFVTPQLKTP